MATERKQELLIGGDRLGDYGWAGPLLVIPVTGVALPALKLVARYTDPYPATWGQVAGAYLYFTVPVLVPGAATPGEVTARIFVRYRRPVPINVDLLLRAELADTRGRRII